MEEKEKIINTLKEKKESVFLCKNFDHSFQITYVVIKENENLLHLQIYYIVLLFSHKTEISHESKTLFSCYDDVIHHLYKMLWTYKLCPECYDLIPNTKPLCESCIPQKYFWEFGIEQKFTDMIPTCTICLEHVYGCKLQCGHYFHLTCFQNMYKSGKPVQCPNCRRKLSTFDRETFFLE